MIIICRDGKPILKLMLYEDSDRKNFIGCASGMFTIPDDFDEIDLESDFGQ